MTKVAIYARYSSNLQRDASIEDQIRVCTMRAEQEGWKIVAPYADHAISGSTKQRTGLSMLMLDAQAGKFDIVLTEGLERLSRDQEDIAGLYKRLSFMGIKIFSLADGGEVSDIHIGLKGTMNALFLKDLAAKTHRGLRGRIEQGKSGGGRAYGYDVVRQFNHAGEPIRGERTINEEQANVIRRIFNEYVAGISPRRIAFGLNADNVRSPTDKGWSASTISGVRRRGTGFINNALYIGKLVWNKHTYVKDPETAKRVRRTNPPETWVTSDVPELRIIDQSVWDTAKAKQKALATNLTTSGNRRPKTLFSGLLKCACCDGNYGRVSKNRFGCTTAKNKRTCDNKITITGDKLEKTILDGLQNHLMKPALFTAFCEEYNAHMEQLCDLQNNDIAKAKNVLEKLAKEKANLLAAIREGIPASEVRDDINRIAAERETAEEYLSNATETPATFHPEMAMRYHEEITALRESLNQDGHIQEGAQVIRALVDKVTLTPDADKKSLKIDVHGDLAGILSLASNEKNPAPLVMAFQSTQSSAETDNLNKSQILKVSCGCASLFLPVIMDRCRQRAYRRWSPLYPLYIA